MESTSCDICGANSFDVLRMEKFTVHASEKWYPVITSLCRQCGHVFSNPRLDMRELSEYYEREYRESFEVPRGEKNGLFQADMDAITALLGFGNSRRVLEVGSYSGYMLARLGQSGWSPEGLEPNLESARVSRDLFPFEVHNCMLEDLPEAFNARYDLVVMGSVLEHVNSPTETLRHVNRLLKAGGSVFIRVPNVEELNLDTVADVFPLEHPHMYAKTTLEMVLNKCGFTVPENTPHDASTRHIACLATKERAGGMDREIENSKHYLKMHRLISEYNDFNQSERNRISRQLEPLVSSCKRIIIYGAGYHTEFLLRYTGIRRECVECIIDSNPRKDGTSFMGFAVKSPEALSELDYDAVVISSRAFQDVIYDSIKDRVPPDTEIVRLYKKDRSLYPNG